MRISNTDEKNMPVIKITRADKKKLDDYKVRDHQPYWEVIKAIIEEKESHDTTEKEVKK